MAGRINNLSSDLAELREMDSLIEGSKPMIMSTQDSNPIDLGTQTQSSKIIYSGYTLLPHSYRLPYLDPLKQLIENYDYALIQNAYGGDGPWADWMAAIDQRGEGYLRPETHAFEETIADLYDGFLSLEERLDVKPPDYEVVSPLVKWGAPEYGPYTWPADVGTGIGMHMATVSMPPAYSGNIALWAALGHETGGHDILHADKGLLNEIAHSVTSAISQAANQPPLKGATALVYNRKVPLADFAIKYWKFCIDETASDVCGLLNLGPAAGVGLAVLLIPCRGGVLPNVGYTDDNHPIDALRIFLAAEVVRSFLNLDARVAAAWADGLERLANKYISNKEGFGLTSDYDQLDVVMPYEPMIETARIAARTIAFKEMKTLEDHSLSDINTWANPDEELTNRIVGDLQDGKEPSLETGPHGQNIYAAHVLAGGVLALANGANIEKISSLVVNSIGKLYDTNPVWRGFPVRFRSDRYMHYFITEYRKPVPKFKQ